MADGPASLCALEFYSGIGGLHYGFKQVVPGGRVLSAFDINDMANLTYQHNHGAAPYQGNIEKLSWNRLDKYRADVWLLSPPCQPFTRQGLQKDMGDSRTRSFLSLLAEISRMKHQPQYLLVENVVGFEVSAMRDVLAQQLQALAYHMQEFILTPTQYGIPYSRPRYFCLACKQPFPLPCLGERPNLCPPYHLMQLSSSGATQDEICKAALHPKAEELRWVQPVSCFLVADPAAEGQVLLKRPIEVKDMPTIEAAAKRRAANLARLQQLGQQQQQQGRQQQLDKQQQEHGQQEEECQQEQGPHATARVRDQSLSAPSCSSQGCEAGAAESAEEHAPDVAPSAAAAPPAPAAAAAAAAPEGSISPPKEVSDAWERYWVPHKVIEDRADVFDVVTCYSLRCNCFTKSYSQYAKGTGSLLATAPQEDMDPAWQLEDGAHLVHATLGASSSCSSSSRGPGGVPTVQAEELVALKKRLELAEAWKALRLRYFTPREIANLHGFPAHFSFPESITLRQRYQLLGNSLSVTVVADLLEYLLHPGHSDAA